jgi:hypothetical protein
MPVTIGVSPWALTYLLVHAEILNEVPAIGTGRIKSCASTYLNSSAGQRFLKRYESLKMVLSSSLRVSSGRTAY